MSYKNRTVNNEGGLSAQDGATGRQAFITSTSFMGKEAVDVAPISLTPGVDYDYLEVTNTSSTTDNLIQRQGGSGGTAIQTITITYASSSVDKVSDSISSVEFS